MAQAISPTEPRFTFFRYSHNHNGATTSPMLFFYTCPQTPGNKAIKTRMLYPLMKRTVLSVASDTAGLDIARRFEVEDPSEITDDLVHSELHPRVEVRQGFRRPKRPGR